MMYTVIRAKNRTKTFIQKEHVLKNGEKIEYLAFPALEEIPWVEQVFSTRLGGVSKEEFSTMNFSFVRGDNPEAVLENYRRIGEIFGKSCDSFVTTDQTHTTNIRVVGKEDAGKGVKIPRGYTDVDGLITAESGLILSCFFADCVPLYFVDVKRRVIGLAHSGWRGTEEGMGACMINRMKEEFGCEPSDMIVGIGASICQNCYEISEEVADKFRTGFWDDEQMKGFFDEAYNLGKYPRKEHLTPGKAADKWQLDLWLANYAILRSAGVPIKNISISDICTCCNADYLFSHRATGGKRGNLGAFLMIKG